MRGETMDGLFDDADETESTEAADEGTEETHEPSSESKPFARTARKAKTDWQEREAERIREVNGKRESEHNKEGPNRGAWLSIAATSMLIGCSAEEIDEIRPRLRWRKRQDGDVEYSRLDAIQARARRPGAAKPIDKTDATPPPAKETREQVTTERKLISCDDPDDPNYKYDKRGYRTPKTRAKRGSKVTPEFKSAAEPVDSDDEIEETVQVKRKYTKRAAPVEIVAPPPKRRTQVTHGWPVRAAVGVLIFAGWPGLLIWLLRAYLK